MKYGRSLQELAIELDRQAKVKKDYVATAGAMQMTAVNENFDLVIGNTPFQLNENAHRQLGLQLKIPAPYYERMRAENPGLLMANVNGWFRQSPDTRRMVRTLDGTARAILSDRYRRIDNYEVAQTVLPIISEMQGARIESCELTDTRMYIKVVNERIQTEVVPGDIVQAGILISNSEVGMGSVSVKPLIYRLVCTNGILYLVMNAKTGHYDIYAKVGDKMELLDDTTVNLSGYVQKETGKGLSTNDYTTAEKTKLAGIADGANKYVHPTHTAAASGLYKVTVDALGHVTATTKVTKNDITALGIPAQDTTYDNATTSAAGLMSAADKTKLDGMTIASDADVTAMLTEIFGA